MKVTALSVLFLGSLIGSLFSIGVAGRTAPAPPTASSAGSIDDAKQTTLVLVNALVSGLFSISDATPQGTSAEDIAANSTAISLLFSAGQSAFDSAPSGLSDRELWGTSTDVSGPSEAVALPVPHCPSAYKLIDASGAPLDPANLPMGAYEIGVMAQLVSGTPLVQEVTGPFLRTYVPLKNSFHPNCVTCHTNYAGLAPGSVVGALATKIRL